MNNLVEDYLKENEVTKCDDVLNAKMSHETLNRSRQTSNFNNTNSNRYVVKGNKEQSTNKKLDYDAIKTLVGYALADDAIKTPVGYTLADNSYIFRKSKTIKRTSPYEYNENLDYEFIDVLIEKFYGLPDINSLIEEFNAFFVGKKNLRVKIKNLLQKKIDLNTYSGSKIKREIIEDLVEKTIEYGNRKKLDKELLDNAVKFIRKNTMDICISSYEHNKAKNTKMKKHSLTPREIELIKESLNIFCVKTLNVRKSTYKNTIGIAIDDLVSYKDLLSSLEITDRDKAISEYGNILRKKFIKTPASNIYLNLLENQFIKLALFSPFDNKETKERLFSRLQNDYYDFILSKKNFLRISNKAQTIPGFKDYIDGEFKKIFIR
jgi:hypothetical protein